MQKKQNVCQLGAKIKLYKCTHKVKLKVFKTGVTRVGLDEDYLRLVQTGL